MQDFFEKSAKNTLKNTFLDFFSKIICFYKKKVVPLHTISKTNKFNLLKLKHYENFIYRSKKTN